MQTEFRLKLYVIQKRSVGWVSEWVSSDLCDCKNWLEQDLTREDNVQELWA